MLALKMIGCLLVIASSTAMGFFFSNEMKCRLENLKELKKLIMLLRGDIRYANTPLPEAISAIARRNPGNFKAFFQSTSQKLQDLSGQTFAEIWK
ncbi:MAG: stage III sporulation protein AD, partial [Clostridiales bacterium]|nr:stage III sporulation protein AD [Clostridiales bacterium]